MSVWNPSFILTWHRWKWSVKSCVCPIALPSAEPPAGESDCLPAYLSTFDTLKPRGPSLTASPCWRSRPTDVLTPICCGCRSCGGELGSAWVAGQHTGPPWLAPVILPSHSSARDINNNSTSGFTLLSRVNPFHCSTDCYCSGWPGPNTNPTPPSLLKSHSSCCQSSFLCLIYCCTISFFSFTESQLTWKTKVRVAVFYIHLDHSYS